MKRIIVTKLIHDIQLGHLYEHIFAISLTSKLRDSGYLAYVDYILDAKTFYSGVIWLELSLYSDNVSKIETIFNNHIVPLDEDYVNGALLQIMAEKQVDISFADMADVVSGLKSIDQTLWVKSTQNKFEASEITSEIFSLKSKKSRNYKMLTQGVTIDMSNPKTELDIPTAIIMASIFTHNLREDVANVGCMFSYDDFWHEYDTHLTLVNLYRVDKRQGIVEADIVSIFKQIKKAVASKDFVKRLANIAGSQPELPSDEAMLDYYGSPVTVAYWKSHLTPEIVQHAIKRISLDIKY